MALAHDDPDEAEPSSGLERWLDERLRAAPSWSVSLALHVVVFGLLATISFGAGGDGLPDDGLWISLAPRTGPARLEVLSRPVDVATREGPAFTATTEPTPERDAPVVVFDVGDGRPDDDDVIRCEWPGVTASAPSAPLAPRRAAARATRRAAGSGAGADARASRGEARLVELSGGCPGPVLPRSLQWLARHQGADGGWSCAGFAAGCAPDGPCSGGGAAEHDVGATGLSLLAFLGEGTTHTTRWTYTDSHTKRRLSPGKAVKRGLDWLLTRQTSDGCVGPKTGQYLYDHAIATLALTEAYGLTTAAAFKGPAQKAVDFLVAAQNPGLGWRYTARSGDNDTSVTGWAVMALKSAQVSGLVVPRAAFDGARAWLDRVTDATGAVGYTAPGSFDVFAPGKNEAWRARPTMTAIGLLSRIFIDRDERDPVLAQGARLLVGDLPRWDEATHEVDSYYWYYGTLALFQLQDAGGPAAWKQWNQAMRQALVPTQKGKGDGCADGSWDPAGDRWGFAGGRVVVTALSSMSLEVHYRYERVFGK